MFEDGERLLDVVGVALVVAVLLALGVVAVAVGAGPTGDAAPDAEWSLERVNDSHVRITHAGGDPVPAAELVITVDGLQRNEEWSGVVTPEESAVVRASERELVRIYWDAGRGERELFTQWRV
jgi:FlaG/FlaF family flagellin (archaellin)